MNRTHIEEGGRSLRRSSEQWPLVAQVLVGCGAIIAFLGPIEVWGYDRQSSPLFGAESRAGITMMVIVVASLFFNVLPSRSKWLLGLYRLLAAATAGLGLLVSVLVWDDLEAIHVAQDDMLIPIGHPILDCGPTRSAIGFAICLCGACLMFVMAMITPPTATVPRTEKTSAPSGIGNESL